MVAELYDRVIVWSARRGPQIRDFNRPLKSGHFILYLFLADSPWFMLQLWVLWQTQQ